MIDLLCDSRTSKLWIASFQLHNGIYDLLWGTFLGRFGFSSRCIKPLVFALFEKLVKFQ